MILSIKLKWTIVQFVCVCACEVPSKCDWVCDLDGKKSEIKKSENWACPLSWVGGWGGWFETPFPEDLSNTLSTFPKPYA